MGLDVECITVLHFLLYVDPSIPRVHVGSYTPVHMLCLRGPIAISMHCLVM